MKKVDMQRRLDNSNMKEKYLHRRLNLHRAKEDDMQRKYDLHESSRFYLHCRLHTITPIAINMQCVDYSITAIEPYLHCM